MPHPAEVLLRQYIECTDTQREDSLLEELIVQHAQPAVRKVVRSKLAFQGNIESQDIEDISADVVVELISRLRTIRSEPSAAIGSFAGYAAVAAYHACNEYLRRKYPNRHRLKTRLRYLLNTYKQFAIWEDERFEWVCGLERWRTEGEPAATSEMVSRWRDHLTDLPRGSSAIHPADLMDKIFGRLGGPVEFDELVGMVAFLWGVDDVAAVSEVSAANVESRAANPGERLELQQWCSELWKQICQLPRAQRVALLLNLRTPGAGSAVALLPLTGVAGISQIAEVLEIPAEEFALMWNQLPMDDLAIAAQLEVTRQQVINLRKSARERLLRRIGGNIVPGSSSKQV
jgi:RNA polymerase sigma factor (sigma-70 family)